MSCRDICQDNLSHECDRPVITSARRILPESIRSRGRSFGRFNVRSYALSIKFRDFGDVFSISML